MKIVILGAGNLATHLVQAFEKSGVEIVQVFSRTEKNAKCLAERVSTAYTTQIKEIRKDADVYIYALSDKALPQIIAQLNRPNALHIHCSGSTSIAVFEGYAKRYGVMYPLQTFSKEQAVDFMKIPLFIEASNEKEKNCITEIANLLTKKIHFVDSENRKRLHLSAVFVCNFVNHMYTIGADLLEENNLPFDLLEPLIEETAAKIKRMSAFDAQTGPALRNDENTIKKQLELLADKKDLVELYRLLTDNIYQRHRKDDEPK